MPTSKQKKTFRQIDKYKNVVFSSEETRKQNTIIETRIAKKSGRKIKQNGRMIRLKTLHDCGL